MKYLEDTPGKMSDFIKAIRSNDLTAVEKMVESKEVDIDCAIFREEYRYEKKDQMPDYTPLTLAVDTGNMGII